MLLVFATTLYITLICLIWGTALLQWMQRDITNVGYALPHVSLICLTGLAAITAFAGVLSLLSEISAWTTLLFLLVPTFCMALFIKKGSLQQIRTSFYINHFLTRFLLFGLTALLLLMGSWTIMHPDTLGYHVQTIEWIRQYKVIPGLVHIDPRLGYQGLWFPVNALFSAWLPGALATNLLNCAVVFWFVLFLSYKIDYCLRQRDGSGFLWLTLLAFSCWQYTQLRLTATSASPDFIVMMLIWAVLYLLQQKQQPINIVLVAIFSFTAISIKLSSFPVIILGLYAIFVQLKAGKWKSLVMISCFGLLLFSSFIIRNSITTGYLLYPSPFPDLIQADWKQEKTLVAEEKNYILTYAKMQNSRQPVEIQKAMQVKMQDWLPVWWQRLSAADKILLLLLLSSFALGIVYRERIATSNIQIKLGLLTMLVGILFWFSSAPAIRFGSGFIIGYIALTVTAIFLYHDKRHLFSDKLLKTGIAAFLLVLFSYCGYRILHFYTPEQVVRPKGIVAPMHTRIMCSGVPVIISSSDTTTQDCKRFRVRGKEVINGFRAAAK